MCRQPLWLLMLVAGLMPCASLHGARETYLTLDDFECYTDASPSRVFDLP